VVDIREGRQQAFGGGRCDVLGPDIPGPIYIERRRIMPLTTVLIALVAVGVVLWLVNTYIPMDAKIKKILNIVVVIVVVLWLLRAFGILDSLSGVRVGR
jgi:hypothetical protein